MQEKVSGLKRRTKTMKNNQKVLDFYKEQAKFGYIESITVYKDIEDGNMTNNLRLSLFNYPYTKGDERLVITFQNIVDLKIKELNGLYNTVFSVTDISSYQIENVKFKIVEDENNLLFFSCKDFEFNII